jgi:hypothetical protein
MITALTTGVVPEPGQVPNLPLVSIKTAPAAPRPALPAPGLALGRNPGAPAPSEPIAALVQRLTSSALAGSVFLGFDEEDGVILDVAGLQSIRLDGCAGRLTQCHPRSHQRLSSAQRR